MERVGGCGLCRVCVCVGLGEGLLGAKFKKQNTCVFTLKLQRAKIPKYRQNTKIQLRFKMLKYRLYRSQFQRPRRHFSAFFKLSWKNREKTPQNPRNRAKPSHQNLENFENAQIFDEF